MSDYDNEYDDERDEQRRDYYRDDFPPADYGADENRAAHLEALAEQAGMMGDDEDDLADDNDAEAGDENKIIVHQVVWNCDHCGEQNVTNRSDDAPCCAECARVYDWISIAGDGTYEQTMTEDGDIDFDAYVPDLPDDFKEPEPPDEPMPDTAADNLLTAIHEDSRKRAEFHAWLEKQPSLQEQFRQLHRQVRDLEAERDARGNILNHAIERAESLGIPTGNSWYQAIDRMADEIKSLRRQVSELEHDRDAAHAALIQIFFTEYGSEDDVLIIVPKIKAIAANGFKGDYPVPAQTLTRNHLLESIFREMGNQLAAFAAGVINPDTLKRRLNDQIRRAVLQPAAILPGDLPGDLPVLDYEVDGDAVDDDDDAGKSYPFGKNGG